MNDFQKSVQEFHLQTGGRGTIYTREGQVLRARLILEEAVETAAALGFHVTASIYDRENHENDTLFTREYDRMDLLDFIDGLADLTYVTMGGAVNADVNLQRHFDEVHDANMRKLEGPVRADGKRLKPEGWTGPDHQKVLDLYMAPSEEQPEPWYGS